MGIMPKKILLEKHLEKEEFERCYRKVEVLQADLDEWLPYYNQERPHQGYRNLGRRPVDGIEEYLETVRKEG